MPPPCGASGPSRSAAPSSATHARFDDLPPNGQLTTVDEPPFGLPPGHVSLNRNTSEGRLDLVVPESESAKVTDAVGRLESRWPPAAAVLGKAVWFPVVDTEMRLTCTTCSAYQERRIENEGPRALR